MNQFKKVKLLFLSITIVGAVHMSEQILFGIEEFYMIKGLLGKYYALYSPDYEGQASVILITIVGTTLSFMCYGLLCGGRPALFVVGVFAFLGITEVHHSIDAITKMNYDPGLITSFAYVANGALLFAEVRRLWRDPSLRS